MLPPKEKGPSWALSNNGRIPYLSIPICRINVFHVNQSNVAHGL
jgi:hypothetical protein